MQTKRVRRWTPMAVLVATMTWQGVGQGAETETYTGSREQLHVYLLIGQSNMAGRAPIPKEDEGVIPGCYLLNNEDRWEPAKNPFNRYSTIRKDIRMQKMNPGYTFCQTLRQQDPDVSIGMVVNARGGTSIEEWAKGGRYYTEAVRRAKKAQQTGTLKGILWHQGEGNEKDAQYLRKLKELVADLRADLGNEKLIFVAGQVNEAKVVNEQIARLPAEVPFTAAVSSEGLKAMDRWHFDTPSMKILGQRYAEAVLKLQNPKGKTLRGEGK